MSDFGDKAITSASGSGFPGRFLFFFGLVGLGFGFGIFCCCPGTETGNPFPDMFEFGQNDLVMNLCKKTRIIEGAETKEGGDDLFLLYSNSDAKRQDGTDLV